MTLRASLIDGHPSFDILLEGLFSLLIETGDAISPYGFNPDFGSLSFESSYGIHQAAQRGCLRPIGENMVFSWILSISSQVR